MKMNVGQSESLLGILNRKRSDDTLKSERHVHFQPLPRQNYQEYSDPEMNKEEEESEDIQGDANYLSNDIKNFGNISKVPRLTQIIFETARDSSHNLILPNLLQESNENVPLNSDEIQSLKKIRQKTIEIFFGLSNAFDTSLETVYLASFYLDKILDQDPSRIPPKDPNSSNRELQLFILSLFWIASKFFDRFPPRIANLAATMSASIKESDFIKTEISLLSLLDFQLNYHTPRFFIRGFLETIEANQELGEIITFFCDLSLFDPIFRSYPPYIVAYASTVVGLHLKNLHHSFSYVQLQNSFPINESEVVLTCAQKLVGFALYYFENQTFLTNLYSNPPFSNAILGIATSLSNLQIE